MLHGKGNQYWMTIGYDEDRKKALEDRTKYSDAILEKLEVLDDITLGGGKTDDDSYIIKQFPFPLDPSIRSKKEIDLREVDKRTGGTI